ncbi:MAG: ATP-binding protein [Gemmatimonas sp.]
MLTTRLGEDQRFVTRTLRVVIAFLFVLAADAIYNAAVTSSPLVWAELGVLIVAIVLIEVALRRQFTSKALLRTQQQLNEQLRASEAKFSGILAIAADAIIVMDKAQIVMHFNHGAEVIFGYAAAEVIGQPLEMLLPSRFRDAHQAHIQKFATSGDSARRMGHRRAVAGRRKDGSEFPAEAAISQLQAADSSTVFSVVLRDITEQQFAEDAERFLAHSIARMTASLDENTAAARIVEDVVPMLADACVLEIDTQRGPRKSCHARDERARSVLITLAEDYDECTSQLIGAKDIANDTKAFAPEFVDERWIGENVANEEVAAQWRSLHVRSRLTIPLTVGSRIVGHLALFDLGAAGDRFGAQVHFVIEEFSRNAALAIDNARLYATARRATRLRDEVLGLVSHDLRNPLGAIAMCARIMRDSPSPDRDETNRMISAISESAVWMQRLIRDLLDVTSLEAGHLAIDRHPVVASSLVSSAVDLMMAELATKDLKFSAEVEKDLPTINVDGARIVQVLTNIIGNAIKFTPSFGTISVNVQRTPEGLLFSVSDSGVGIAPEMHTQIFDRFWQEHPAHNGGHGLGLAIAQGIVQGHGGRLWVESEVGKGSIFRFVIPIERSFVPANG